MQKRTLSLFVTCSLLAACGGGGVTDSAQSPTQDVSAPVTITTDTPTVGTDIVPSGGATTTPTSTDGTTTPTDGSTTPSGGTTTQVIPPVVVTPPPPPELLAYFAFDTSSNSVSAGSGSLEQSNDRITLSGLSGTISEDQSVVILDNGGQITLVPSDTTNVGLFQIEPIIGDPSFGVYGHATDFATFSPGASATYNGVGTAVVQIIDGTYIYDLTGDVSAQVDFNDGLVDFAILGLQGQRTDGLSASVQISDAAQLGVTGGQLSNGIYSGGVANFTSTHITTPLSGAENVASTGGLFGDAAQEIGGVFVIDDSVAAGNLLIQGQYVGN